MYFDRPCTNALLPSAGAFPFPLPPPPLWRRSLSHSPRTCSARYSPTPLARQSRSAACPSLASLALRCSVESVASCSYARAAAVMDA